MKLHLSNYQHLIEQGLVKESVDAEKGLVTLKYARKVFYKNLWHVDDLLLEARGHVFDMSTGELVQRPFKKVFNLGENGAGDFLSDTDYVMLVEKVNGFMAALTFLEDGTPLVSTTGSTKSDYATLAQKVLQDNGIIQAAAEVFSSTHKFLTFMFEICDPSDPHIVKEDYGAHFIGVIAKHEGCQMPATVLRRSSSEMKKAGATMHFPSYTTLSFETAKQMVSEARTEGFMVLSPLTEDVICKVKTPHYLAKKFLMRMNFRRAQEMMNNPEKFKQTIDEEFYELIDYLTSDLYIETHRKPFSELSEQERREMIESYFQQ